MNRILSTAIAAAIAITTFGATAPAMSAPLAPAAPAATQAADSLITPVHHKKWHKGKGHKSGWGKGGINLHLGFPFGGSPHFSCWQNQTVWTKHGPKLAKVYVC